MRNLLFISTFILAWGVAPTAFAQALQTDLALKYLVQLPQERSLHTDVVILLHGYGSNEADLFELRYQFPKNCLIVSARAPKQLSPTSFEWYESIMTDGHKDGNRADLEKSRAAIVQFIKQVEKKYHAAPGDVYLAGFSQGAIMSYQVGLTNPSLIKGIGVLSGIIYPSLKPLVKIDAELKKLKIFIAHGTADERLAFGDARASADYLEKLGLKPEFHAYSGMGHTISGNVMKDLLQWMK